MDSAPWLSHYDGNVPPTLVPYPERTLVDCITETSRAYPRQPALLFKGTTITYGELDALSDACASAFISLGVKRGDRVALLLPNTPQFLIAEIGAWKAGAIVAPLNPTYTERELEIALTDNGAETIVTLTRFYHRVKAVQPRTRLTRVIATNIKEYFPPLLRLLFTIALEKRHGDRTHLAPGDHDFAHLLLVNRGRKPPHVPLSPADPAILLMSGGTTGTPKSVLGTHGAYVVTGQQILAWFASVIEVRKDIILTALPLFHVYANLGVQPHAFVMGGTLALVPNPRDIDDVLTTIQRVRPTFFPAVPTLFIALLNHRKVQEKRVDFTSIKISFSGAAALMADTKHRFESLTGSRIVEGYSLTEAMMAICANPVTGRNKIGSVGMPFPDVRIAILDQECGTRMMAAKEVGEICFAAPQLMSGFWNRPEETAQVLREHPELGGGKWLHTGDLGYLDEDGYLFIVDRKKDLIKTSGYQVWPREVEEVLAAHPAVKEVGVAGVSDPVRIEAVKAWVVLRNGQTATETELRAFCRERLAPYKVPSHIEFRSELPKTMVGKVLRRALRDQPQ